MRVVIVYAALLACALLGAYLSWTSEQATDREDKVAILDIEREEISEVRFESNDILVKLVPKKDELGSYVWTSTVRTVKKPRPSPVAAKHEENTAGPTADAGTNEAKKDPSTASEPTRADGKDDALEPAGASGEDEGKDSGDQTVPEVEMIEEEEVAEFRGNTQADDLIASLAPFFARRELEGFDDAKLADLGLHEPEAKLIVVSKRGESVFELGDTVFGGATRYVRDADSKKVYLVDAKTLRPLANAHHTLVDRDLFRGKESEIARLVVEAGGNTLELERRNRSDAKASYWANAGSDDRNESAEAWLKKLFRLRAREYVVQAPPTLETVFVFTVYVEDSERSADGSKPIRVEVLRGPSESGEELFYARSTHLRSLVELHGANASPVVADVAAVMTGGAAAKTAELPAGQE